jgi:predicted glutamine amidotransferase
MCRLYALRANEPTRVECSLVRAQNALMAQSRGDREGLMHGHGWGVAHYGDGLPLIEKNTWAAHHGEHFQKKVARIYAHTVVAHVRRATVGPPSLENTHPFMYGRWTFAHNGTLPHFDQMRPRLLEHTDPVQRASLNGQTDSEHIFHYLLTFEGRGPDADLLETVRLGLQQIVVWCAEIDPKAPISLNIVLTDGERLVGSRLNRSLWFLARDHTFVCPICGQPHVQHQPGVGYRSIEVASEPLTNEKEWKAVPDGTVYSVDPDFALRFEPLDLPGDGRGRAADSPAD